MTQRSVTARGSVTVLRQDVRSRDTRLGIFGVRGRVGSVWGRWVHRNQEFGVYDMLN
jgi:hypothetical protein